MVAYSIRQDVHKKSRNTIEDRVLCHGVRALDATQLQAAASMRGSMNRYMRDA